MKEGVSFRQVARYGRSDLEIRVKKRKGLVAINVDEFKRRPFVYPRVCNTEMNNSGL